MPTASAIGRPWPTSISSRSTRTSSTSPIAATSASTPWTRGGWPPATRRLASAASGRRRRRSSVCAAASKGCGPWPSDTDGIAVIDTNDIDTGLKRIVADMSSYYLVGYYTKNAKLDGRFRKITVRVKRPGVNVRARRGYKAATAAELAPPKETAAKVSGPSPQIQAALAGITSSRASGRADIGRFRAPRQRHRRSGADVDGRGTRPRVAQGGLRHGRRHRGDCRRQRWHGALAGTRDVCAWRPHRGRGYRRRRPGWRRHRGAHAHQAEGRGRGASTDTAVVAAASLTSAAPLLWRRGPSTQMRFVADSRLAVHPCAIACAPTCWWPTPSSTVTALLLDRVGATIAVPVTAGSRADGAADVGHGGTGAGATGPQRIRVEDHRHRPRRPSDVYTGIRVVP